MAMRASQLDQDAGGRGAEKDRHCEEDVDQKVASTTRDEESCGGRKDDGDEDEDSVSISEKMKKKKTKPNQTRSVLGDIFLRFFRPIRAHISLDAG